MRKTHIQIAQDPSTPTQVLKVLFHSTSNINVKLEIAKNPNIDEELLVWCVLKNCYLEKNPVMDLWIVEDPMLTKVSRAFKDCKIKRAPINVDPTFISLISKNTTKPLWILRNCYSLKDVMLFNDYAFYNLFFENIFFKWNVTDFYNAVFEGINTSFGCERFHPDEIPNIKLKMYRKLFKYYKYRQYHTITPHVFMEMWLSFMENKNFRDPVFIDIVKMAIKYNIKELNKFINIHYRDFAKMVNGLYTKNN